MSAVSTGLPHSREAEEAVLGAVLINPEVYDEVAAFLQPRDFYIIRLRWIWEAYHPPERETHPDRQPDRCRNPG